MAIIDIGPAAINRSTTEGAGNTLIMLDNPANETGTITSIEIWANSNLSNVEVAIFYNVSGDNYATRDTHTIGSVTSGSKQTFSGLNLDVQSGDYIGMYWTAGNMEQDGSGYGGIMYKSGDKIPCTSTLFFLFSGRALSIYGTGTTAVGNAIFFGSNF